MTVNAARRNRRRPPEPQAIAPTESLAIGEINQTVFDCPVCARPLAVGARRCPGCGTRLLLGIQAGKASVLAGLGLVVGIALGGAFGYGVGLGRAGAAAAAAKTGSALSSPAPVQVGGGATTTATVSPTDTPGTGGSGGATASGSPISRSALLQALGVNGRLRAGAVALRTALAANVFDASTVAQTLRTLSAESVFGQQVVGRMADWPVSFTLVKDLASMYDAVHQTAIEGLVASVRDDAAYRATAVAMLKVLDGLPALDREGQAVAAEIGLEIPPPSAAPSSRP
ncbi:MAG TPA: hypothetical protein VIM24_00900 [Candidatus Limnocylindrales bacterium]|jgi:hypothetical protein